MKVKGEKNKSIRTRKKKIRGGKGRYFKFSKNQNNTKNTSSNINNNNSSSSSVPTKKHVDSPRENTLSNINYNNNLPSVSTKKPLVVSQIKKNNEENNSNKSLSLSNNKSILKLSNRQQKNLLRRQTMQNKRKLLAKQILYNKKSISTITSTPKIINNNKNNNNNKMELEDFDCSIIEETKEIIIIDDDDDEEEEEEDVENNVVNNEILSFNEISDTNENNIKQNDKEQSSKIVIDNNSNNDSNLESTIEVSSTNNICENLQQQQNTSNNENVKNSNNNTKENEKFNDITINLYKNYALLIETITSGGSSNTDGTTTNKINNETIICLDDDSIIKDNYNNKSSSLVKNKNNEEYDDSIIFVSESIDVDKFKPSTSKALDFIPLSTDSPNSPRSKNNYSNNEMLTPLSKRTGCGDLFTSSEQKKIRNYNTNIYIPNKNEEQEQQTGKRMVLIDGSNIAFHHALSKEFSVKGLEICLEYFEKMGYLVKAIVPQFRLKKYKSTDPDKLEKLYRDGKIVLTPCKNLPGKSAISYDDRFLLQLASELDAAVISNDNYRDLINENPAFKKIIENRVIGYTWCNDLFILPKDPYGRLGPKLSTILNRT